MVGSVALGRFGHSVTSLGDLNNDGCDGQHLPVVMMCVQWWIVLQILLLVLHLMKEEKCSFTMGLRRLKPNPVMPPLLVKLVTCLVICSAVIVCVNNEHTVNTTSLPPHTCLLHSGVDSSLLRPIVNEHFSSFIKWSTNSNICSTIHHWTHIITTGKC